MKHLPRSVSVLILVFAILFSGGFRVSNACGPFSKYAIFSFSKHPDLPFDNYSSGNVGVVNPSYARAYLYVAYRLMSGGSFNKDELAALSEMWKERLDNNLENQDENTRESWLATRKKVPGVAPNPTIEMHRAKGKDEYDSFLNCNADAFKTAARTLDERIAKFGAASPEVKEWTSAQDQVFSNCGGGQTIPDEASTSSSPVIQADRAYQIAAANFYSMNFDGARAQFEKIASDSSSPWREHADYLVARSLIRKGSLGEAAGRSDAFSQAEAQLRKVIAKNGNAALRRSAENLLNLVELRLHPEVRVRALAEALMKKEANANLRQDLLDYTLLLDKYIGDSDQAFDENLKKAVDATPKDDLTEWLLNYQSPSHDAEIRAIEKWESSNSIPWLVAAIMKIDATSPKAAALMSAAERVQTSSPAFATVQFHVLRLMIEKGASEAARLKLDGLLRAPSALPPSAANRFRHLRMLVATSLDDFLKFALREPAAFSWDEDGRESPIALNEDDELKPWAGRALLDVDSTNLLNKYFPLSMLREAASSKVLPDHVRRQFALATWTRAILLEDEETAKAMAPLAASLAPELRVQLNTFMNSPTRPMRKSAALYTILKFPGLRPYVESSTGRLTPMAERDIYRDNWWCDILQITNVPAQRSEITEEETGETKRTVDPLATMSVEFLSKDQTAIAKREHAQLMALGTAPNYLVRETIEWATRAPDDQRVPEALHIAVTATRYGCTDKETSGWSKAAFQLLHKRYPNSAWAKKTPYWFKDN